MYTIRLWRLRRGLSQQELARRAGCGQSFLSEIETGKANPTQSTLEHIAHALGLSVSQLFTDPLVHATDSITKSHDADS